MNKFSKLISITFLAASSYCAFAAGVVESASGKEAIADPLPLNNTMDQNMREMPIAYIHKMGVEMQLRGINLYAMGEALSSHTDHPLCQAEGKKALASARTLYLAGKDLNDGKEVGSQEMQNFVKQWTLTSK